ncbi:hypothetical protein ACFMPD_01660 [Sedimentitalea sp. HM32M-2]|uniref:hypothetical protein n=1 Tax=Sedimentitalea sp. HM32M-2 TaxID=3351566 RepID=UPI0036326B51
MIICNSIYAEEQDLTRIRPTILTFDRDNRVQDVMTYVVGRGSDGRYSFAIEQETAAPRDLAAG